MKHFFNESGLEVHENIKLCNNIDDTKIKRNEMINEYKKQIACYKQDRDKMLNLIKKIENIISVLATTNVLMEEVIITGRQYDDDFLENTISDLTKKKSDFLNFIADCDNEINRLYGCIKSLGGGF